MVTDARIEETATGFLERMLKASAGLDRSISSERGENK